VTWYLPPSKFRCILLATRRCSKRNLSPRHLAREHLAREHLARLQRSRMYLHLRQRISAQILSGKTTEADPSTTLIVAQTLSSKDVRQPGKQDRTGSGPRRWTFSNINSAIAGDSPVCLVQEPAIPHIQLAPLGFLTNPS